MSMNYNLQGTLNNYLQRFPQATLGQFRGYLNTNYPQMSNQFLRNLTAEELNSGLNQTGGLGKAANRLLGKGAATLGRGLRAIGPLGDILNYGLLPMRKDEILKEYGLQIDENGNLYGRT